MKPIALNARVLGVVLALCSSFSSLAHAACFREAPGVPGNSGQAPEWWNSSTPLGESGTRWIDDARWNGSSAFGEAYSNLQFRGLMDTDGANRYLVLMWYVRSDENSTTGDDRIFFGLHDDTMNKGAAIRINATSLTPVEGATPGGLAFYTYDGSTWTAQATPSWLSSDAKLDVFTGDEWAIRVRVPITTSATSLDKMRLTSGGTYKFFHQVQSDATDTTAHYDFPDPLTFITDDSDGCLNHLCVQPPANWASFQDTSSCLGDIAIQGSHISVGPMAGNTQIDVMAANEIHARPVSYITSNVDQRSVRARYRLANWGSVIGVSPTWEKLTCTETMDEDYVLAPTGTVAAWDGVSSPNPFEFTCTWSVPVADRPRYDPACTGSTCRNRDQCVMVELDMSSGAPGTPYSFAPQSAKRNLQFVNASTIKKSAQIDVRGLQAGDPARDVYLYVKTRNMPERITDNTPLPAQLIGKELSTKLRKAKVGVPEGRSVGKKTAVAIQTAMASGLLDDDDVEAFMPTYTVYAWHDTGKKHKGKAILKAQAPFGYVVFHDGPLEGWHTSLQAPGYTLTEISENYYRLSVPKGGQATVVSTIQALEKPPCDCELTEVPPHEHPHEHTTVPPHTHPCAACRMPGHSEKDSGFVWAALGLGLLSIARRRVRSRANSRNRRMTRSATDELG